MRTVVIALALVLTASSAFAENLSKKDFKKLKRRALVALKSGDTATLAGLLSEIGDDDSSRGVDLLARIVIQEGDFGVYQASRRALAGIQDADAVEHMCRKVEKRGGDARLKILLIDAFTDRDDEPTAAALASALNDRRPEVLRAVVTAIAKRKPIAAVDPLLDLYGKLVDKRDTESLLGVSVYDTLVALTGRGFEVIEDWRKYWQTVRADRSRVVTGGLAASAGTSERAPKPTFFGTEIKSDRLVFVIDTSGSMTATDPGSTPPPSTGGSPEPKRGPMTGGGDEDGDSEDEANKPPPVSPSRVRIERAKFQLKHVIASLSDRSAFTIVAYSSGCKIWNKNLQAANAKNKESAIAFIEGLQPSGTTLTLGAMKAAFEIEGPDAIILLSDGFPTESDPDTGGAMTNDKILSEIAELNRWKRWRVDTFGFSSGGSGMGDFMGDLATQNGGDYTDIP